MLSTKCTYHPHCTFSTNLKPTKGDLYELLLGKNKILRLTLRTYRSKIFEKLLITKTYEKQSALLIKNASLRSQLFKKNLIFFNFLILLVVMQETILLKNYSMIALYTHQEAKTFNHWCWRNRILILQSFLQEQVSIYLL